MFYLENNNFLSKDSIHFIEDYVLSNKFPLYMQPEAVLGDGSKNLTHIVLPRIEEREELFVFHPHHENFVGILNDFCKVNKISYNEILRICVNVTFNNGTHSKSPTHCDHDFEHNQLLVYLNNPLDKKSSTILLDDDGNIDKEIFPEKYKGVCFNKVNHYLYYPKVGIRYIIVFTFR